MFIDGAIVNFTAGKSAEQKNTLLTTYVLDVDYGGILNLNQPFTSLITKMSWDSGPFLRNNGLVNATADSFGLSEKDDVWSSSNLDTAFEGDGRLNLTGMPATLSKEGFKSLRETVGGGILKVDSTISGAVVDGKTDLADVVAGAAWPMPTLETPLSLGRAMPAWKMP